MMKMTWCFLLSVIWVGGYAQHDSTAPPYKRFPTLPPVQLLLGDSTTKYTKADLPKNKPVLFMLFSPDCSHCQHTAEELINNKAGLKDIQIVLATLHPLWEMNGFVEKYRLKSLPNLVVGKDIYFIMPSFYNIKNLPYMAFYNKKGGLISTFEGSLSIEKVMQIFRDNR